LEKEKVAIVGVGGTGSYVLDLIAKTRVAEIHIFDGDDFEPHNAFRSPGAWSLEELDQKKTKVQNFYDTYSKLRRKGLVKHDEPLTATNLELLTGVTFVFLCMDAGKNKRAIVDWLIANGVAFIEVGMGITRAPTGLQGLVRVVTSTAAKRDHINARLSFGEDEEPENEYATNIQIAELNALNAAMAVIRWKRLIGFYRDAGHEHYSGYQLATGEVCNEDVA
jgi:molybdopterin/thiamine biosynthesis adenylyltransferase